MELRGQLVPAVNIKTLFGFDLHYTGSPHGVETFGGWADHRLGTMESRQ